MLQPNSIVTFILFQIVSLLVCISALISTEAAPQKSSRENNEWVAEAFVELLEQIENPKEDVQTNLVLSLLVYGHKGEDFLKDCFQSRSSSEDKASCVTDLVRQYDPQYMYDNYVIV